VTVLDVSAARLRHALEWGSYEEAQKILADYSRQIAELLKRLPPDHPQASDLVREARDLLDWAHRMACSGRAHSCAQLAQLMTAVPYRRLNRQKRPTWQLEA
jgi:hypothetical protein